MKSVSFMICTVNWFYPCAFQFPNLLPNAGSPSPLTPAGSCCYDLGSLCNPVFMANNLALMFWTPIDIEFDDYIVNPKPSGYQVLTTLLGSNKNTGASLIAMRMDQFFFLSHFIQLIVMQALHEALMKQEELLPCIDNQEAAKFRKKKFCW